MNWNDRAIILNIRKYGESSLILKVISENNGIYSGFIKGAIKNKKKQGNYQIGNIIQANWQAKTSNGLGFMNIELLKSTWTYIINSQIKLDLMMSALSLVEQNFSEREENQKVFFLLENLLEILKNKTNFLPYYVLFEVNLLKLLGYEFNLSEYTISEQNNNSQFTSPKLAGIISGETGELNENKLLILPNFIFSKNTEGISNKEILNGLKLTSYFLNKHLYQSKEKSMTREKLIKSLEKYFKINPDSDNLS